MAAPDVRDLAQRLAIALPTTEREAFERVRVRLSKLLARLWEMYAELLETHGSLAEGGERLVDPPEFRPGDTLRVGESYVRTDPRLILAERMNIPAWADLIGELAAAVLQSPDLARREVLTVLTELDHRLLRELCDLLMRDDSETDEFPVQPSREAG